MWSIETISLICRGEPARMTIQYSWNLRKSSWVKVWGPRGRACLKSHACEFSEFAIRPRLRARSKMRLSRNNHCTGILFGMKIHNIGKCTLLKKKCLKNEQDDSVWYYEKPDGRLWLILTNTLIFIHKHNFSIGSLWFDILGFVSWKSRKYRRRHFKKRLNIGPKCVQNQTKWASAKNIWSVSKDSKKIKNLFPIELFEALHLRICNMAYMCLHGYPQIGTKFCIHSCIIERNLYHTV